MSSSTFCPNWWIRLDRFLHKKTKQNSSKNRTARVETENVHYPTGRASLAFPPVSSRSASCLPASRDHTSCLDRAGTCLEKKKKEDPEKNNLQTNESKQRVPKYQIPSKVPRFQVFQPSVLHPPTLKARSNTGNSKERIHPRATQAGKKTHLPCPVPAGPALCPVPCPALPCPARTTAIRAVPHRAKEPQLGGT